MAVNQNRVGPPTGNISIGPSVVLEQRAGQLGETVVSELHGPYYENNYRRNAYVVASTALVQTTVGLSTTYTGLVLSNPVGNTWNLSINKVGCSFMAPAATPLVYGLMCGYNGALNVIHTTPLTVASAFWGVGSAPTAKADATATSGLSVTPQVTHIFGTLSTAAGSVSNFMTDLQGSLIIPPAGFVAFYTNIASASSGFAAFMTWEEIPV